MPVDERPALMLAKVADERRRRELMLLLSALEGPTPRPASGWWVVGLLGALACFLAT